jgi:hypothetical protein
LPVGSVVFVHGTGVRLAGFRNVYDAAVRQAARCSFTPVFIPCAWGDPLGSEFEGRSLPDPPSEDQLARQEAELAQWAWLLDDPLLELSTLTIRDRADALDTIGVPHWEQTWDQIAAYQPTEELLLLLDRGSLRIFWPAAWDAIVKDSMIASDAFEASAHELPVAARALARGLVAALHDLATDHGVAGPTSRLRNQLVAGLLADWGQTVLGISDLFFNLVKRAGTRFARARRNQFNQIVAFPIGDVLLYQSRGDEIRSFIRRKIELAEPPVTLIAHSLGGIACVDLLALPDAPAVGHLVTAGSQSPFFYEIGALTSLKIPQALPISFPPWLNIFDRNDLLSFVAKPLFSNVTDIEVTSGQPFPDSHSHYFADDAVWNAIRDFVAAKQ